MEIEEKVGLDVWKEVGLSQTLVEDLALKILFLETELSLRELAERMKLGLPVVEHVFQRLRKEQFVEVKGLVGGVYWITTTGQGKAHALELLSLNQYSGPAPVPLKSYIDQVLSQSVRNITIKPGDVDRGFRHLVLSKEARNQIGTAIVSGTSLFLHGPSGTGKTAIAETIPTIYHDAVWIPYAVEIEGQIITVFDPGIHQPISPAPEGDHDGRWVLCRRPRVIVGGELTIEMLDLQFNPVTKFYSAPAQMKANNGVLIVDDFGRQRMRPEELLNRWILPLDRKIDILTLIGGKKFEIPFDLFVVFATNLDLRELGDDAFLRRISSKIKMNFVSPAFFHEIFQQVCQEYTVQYDRALVDEFINVLTSKWNEPLRPCYPRDIIRQICWLSRYEGKPPRLEPATLAQACRNYFLSAESN